METGGLKPAGDFIRRTAAPGQTAGFDASTFFLQYNFRW